ncbi:MAG: hypothetical protein ABIJ40_18915 [Bacteroidota bacterium]
MKKLLLIFLLVPILMNAQIRRAFLFEQNGLNIYPTTSLSNLLPYSNQLGSLGSNSIRWNFGYFDTTIANHTTSSMFSGSGLGLTSIPISGMTGLQDSLNLKQYIYVNKLSSDSLGLASPFTKFNFGSSSRLYFGNLWQIGTAENYFAGNIIVGSAGLGAYGVFNISITGNHYTALTIGDGTTVANAGGIYFRSNGTLPAGISTAGAPLAFYVGGPAANEVMRMLSNGNVGIGTIEPYFLNSSLSTSAQRNAWNFTSSITNTNRTDAIKESDTSSVTLTFTGTGSPIWKITGKTGNNLFQIDSANVTAHKFRFNSVGAIIDSATIIGDTLKFYVNGISYKAIKGSSFEYLWIIGLSALIGLIKFRKKFYEK